MKAAILGLGVVALLAVVPARAQDKATAGQEVREAGEKTKDGAEKVVRKTKKGAKKAGNEITDAWIITRVKSRFINEAR